MAERDRFSKEFYIKAYRALKTAREVEKLLRIEARGMLSQDGKSRIHGATLTSFGQEAISVGAVLAAEPQDWFAFDHRSAGGYLARGVTPYEFFLQYLQKSCSLMGGYDGNIHLMDFNRKILRFISDMMAHVPVANGTTEGNRYRREFLKEDIGPACAVAITGNGAASQGLLHGVFNDSSIHKLPVVYIINDNQFAISPDKFQPQSPVEHLALRGVGYGIPFEIVDGNDVLLIYDAVSKALESARNGGGPKIIECKTRRQSGHNETQDMRYTFPVLNEWCEWVGRDPLIKLRDIILSRPKTESVKELFTQRKPVDEICVMSEKMFNPEEIRAIDAEIETAVKQAFDSAVAAADPDPRQNGFRKALSPLIITREETPKIDPKKNRLTMAKAIQQAYAEAMREKPLIRHFGEDVGHYGGTFGITKPLYEEFGDKRIYNFQLDEPSMVGNAIGQAHEGIIPVIEFQFFPFSRSAWAQISNMLARAYFHARHELHVIMRAPCGGGFSGGDFHSAMPEMEYIHEHGIVVVFPSTPYDAKGLVHTALHEKKPVLFLEQIKSYHDLKLSEPVPELPYTIPFGKARVAKTGKDLTIITYGPLMLHGVVTPAVVEFEKQQNAQIEIIDLRTLHPLDWRTMTESAIKTGKVLVIHEASKEGGLGQSITSRLSEITFPHRIRTHVLGSLDTPVASHPNLEWFRLPSKEKVLTILEKMLSGGRIEDEE